MKVEVRFDDGKFSLNIGVVSLDEAEAFLKQVVIPMYNQLGYDLKVEVVKRDGGSRSFVRV